jgi:uncharacterized protein with HEPN domain
MPSIKSTHCSPGKTLEDVQADRVVRAAFERFLEILSEASRHVPQALKQTAPQIPWQNISAIGNHLRHAYDRIDAKVLWDIHVKGQLLELRAVVQEFIRTMEADEAAN